MNSQAIALRIPAPPDWLRIIAPALPALLLLLVTADLRFWLTPDSKQYLLAAENLSQYGVFGDQYVFWPPMYPALLSLHSLFGMEVTTFAALLCKLFSIATIVGVWAIGRLVVASRYALTFGLLALACLPWFGTVFSLIWSETLYVPLSVWLAYFWAKYLATGDRRSLGAACLLLCLAMLTRHVGVVLAIAMVITAVLGPRHGSKQKLASILGIGLACVPYALWDVRTYLLSGTVAGPRQLLPNPDLAQKIELFGRVFEHWVFPHAYFLSGGIVTTAVFLSLFVGCLACFVRQSIGGQRRTDAQEFRLGFLLFAVLFVLGHSVVTIYSASRMTLDVDPRTLFPIFWPALLVLICLVDAPARKSRIVQVGLFAYCVIWFSAPNGIIDALM